MARYGMQPMSELRRMTMEDLTRLSVELSKIVVIENGPGRDD